MDKNKLLIGGAIIVVGGAIAGGLLLNNFDSSSTNRNPDGDMANELEEQNFKDFADEDRYSFCQSREVIKGPYTSSVFGKETGEIEYISEDINVFDKEKNKLFILGREIKYKYSGQGQVALGEGEGTKEIEESGMTVEYYSKFNAPVRIDYNAKLIYPAPERKKDDWVVIETKGVGTIMGFSQERVDKEMGDAKTFCPPFSISSALITPDYFSIDKSCSDGSGLGFNFSGNFKFECGGIDNERGIEIVREYKQLEEARKVFDSSSEDEDEERNEFQDLIKEGQPDNRDIQKKLQELKDEMKAGATARDQ
jgi:hypothetical protein